MKLSLPLPEPLDVEILFVGASIPRTFRVQPATREQVRRTLLLDPADDAELDPVRLEQIRAEQAEILAKHNVELNASGEPMEEYSLPFDQLTGEQAAELCLALMQHHLGQDASQALAIRRAVKKNAIARLWLAACGDSTPTPSPSPATSEPTAPAPSDSGT